MGPDEFHEKYPDSPQPGINDNAYTNIMVVWLFEKALAAYSELTADVRSALAARINFDEAEITTWKSITTGMYVPIDSSGILQQFEGYNRLKELDLDAFRSKYGNIQRMDRILKSQGDSPDSYQICKQADALMPFFALSCSEVFRILCQLGYTITNEQEFLKTNYAFHVRRTTHGSSLSPVVHAVISRNMGHDHETWDWFMQALRSDLHDTQGNTTVEGVHCGVMAGTIGIVVRVFGGVTFDREGIQVDPLLPRGWNQLRFKLMVKGRKYDFLIRPDLVKVDVDPGAGPLSILVRGRDVAFKDTSGIALREIAPTGQPRDLPDVVPHAPGISAHLEKPS